MIFAVIFSAFATGPSVVTLTSGKVRGDCAPDFCRYRGIPYAEPPLKSLRFMPPVEAKPWKPRILDASNFKMNCAQGHFKHGPSWPGLNDTFSEDCLYTNVYAPPRKARGFGSWPVLFFVYGGDYTVGGPNDEQLYGWRGVKELGDAVFVVPGWRQGIFGNLGGREVKAATVDGSSGTAGFADQQMAMRWAFENVAAFGGDPNRILLFGESAGAAAVSMHLVSEGSWPYFSRAAMQSGAFVHWAYLNTSVAQTIFDFFANYTGCAPEKQREKKKGGGGGAKRTARGVSAGVIDIWWTMHTHTWSYSDPYATRLRKYSRVRCTFAAIARGVMSSPARGFCNVPRFCPTQSSATHATGIPKTARVKQTQREVLCESENAAQRRA